MRPPSAGRYDVRQREVASARLVRVVRERLAPMRSLDLRGRRSKPAHSQDAYSSKTYHARELTRWARLALSVVAFLSERRLVLCNERLVGVSEEDRQLWLLTCGRSLTPATSTSPTAFCRTRRPASADRPSGSGNGLGRWIRMGALGVAAYCIAAAHPAPVHGSPHLPVTSGFGTHGTHIP